MRLRHTVILFGLVSLAAPLAAAVTFSVPQYVIPADNAWDHYVAAFALLPPKGDVWDRVESAREPAEADVEALLRAAGPALTELREGLGKPCVPQYPEVGASAAGMPTAFASARATARLLYYEAWLNAQRGDYDAAFASCLDAVTLGQDLARNSGAVARIVGCACESFGCSRLRQTIPMAAHDEPALARLVAGLGDVESREVPYAETLANGHGAAIAYLKWLRDSGQMTRERWQQEYGSRSKGAGLILTRRELDRTYSEAVARAQRPTWEWNGPVTLEPDVPFAIGRFLHRLEHWPRPPKSPTPTAGQKERYEQRVVEAKRGMTKLFTPPNQTLAEALGPSPYTPATIVTHLAKLRGTLLIAALELRRARTNEYPAALPDLVPDTLATLPLDPWSGEPFRYSRVTPTEYRLYSVGADKVDDGGVGQYAGRYRPSSAGDMLFAPGQ